MTSRDERPNLTEKARRKAALRETRLAAALRRNLVRRKRQARARAGAPGDAGAAPPEREPRA